MQFLLRLWRCFLSDRLTERLGRSHVDLECHIFQDSRFRRRPTQPISRCAGAKVCLERFEVREAPCTANQQVRGEGAEPSLEKIGGKQTVQARSSRARCHTGGVSSIRSAGCLYKSLATCTPQCPTEVALDMRGSS